MRRFFAFTLALIMTLSLLPMTVWATEKSGAAPTQQPFALNGIEVYTKKDDGKGNYEDWDTYDGLTTTKAGDPGSQHDAVRVLYTPGQQMKLFLKAADPNVTLTGVGGGLKDHATLGAIEESTGIYELVLSSAATGGGNVWIDLSSGNGLDIMFEPVGNQGSTPTQQPFALNGIEVYTQKNQGVGTYENWTTYDGLTTTKAGPEGSQHDAVRVLYTPGQQMRLFLKAANPNVTLTEVGGALKDHVTLSAMETSTGIYELVLSNTATTGGSNVWINLSSGNGLDIIFEPVGNPGDNRTFLEYYTERGYSKIVVEVFPGVEEVVDFPDPGVLENDTLLLTVKNADPEKWRPLLNRGDDAFWVPYTIEAINPPAGATAMPKIAFNGGDDLTSARVNLQNMLNENSYDHFFDYNDKMAGPSRNDAAQYAWRSSSSGGIIKILPQTETKARAWCWRYDVENASDRMDWFATQVVLADGVADVITVTEQTYPAVDANRIQLIPHAELDKVLGFSEYKDGAFAYQAGQEGVLTYTYIGSDTTKPAAEVIYAAANNEQDSDVRLDGNNILQYNLLTVKAPVGYVAKEVQHGTYFSQTTGFNADGSVALRFHWRGAYEDLTFTVTWSDAAPDNAPALDDKVEQVTISMPNMETSSGPWMSYAVIGQNTYAAHPVDASRLKFDSLADVKGVASHVYNAANGVLFTTYDNNSIVAADPIRNATFSVSAPAGAVSFSAIMGRDGTNDPAYNSSNAWKSEFFWQEAVKGNPRPIPENGVVIREPIDALLKQTYGKDIEYYYSADEATRYLLIKWNFDGEQAPLFEYLQLDTSSYHCQWRKEVKKDSEVPDEVAVDVPTAINDMLANGDILLVADIHVQTTAEKFFFELEIVDKNNGNVVTEFNGEVFTIILPYEFMGNDPDGNPWCYETAIRMKEAKIKHFDDDFTLKDNNGVIFGTFTPRGIEFVVDSFSPFMLELTEKEYYTVTLNANGGTVGGDSTATCVTTADKKLTSLPTPTRSGYTFNGWFDAATDGNQVTMATVFTCDTTVYAQWTKIVSGGGGSSSAGSSSGTTTEKNPDGSTTTTTTDKTTGTVTETTKNTDGTTGVTKTDANGNVTEVFANVPVAAAKAADKTGEPVTLPIEVEVGGNSAEATEIKVNVPSTGATVEIPVENVTPSTVVVIVNADGTESIVPLTTLTEDGVVVTLEDDATIKVVDNSKDFTDVADDYALAGSIDFVSARGLFEGTTATTFNPHADTTIAQTMTVLARLSGEDFYGAGSTSKGAEWATAKGLSDGTDVSKAITREQMVLMMWKLVGMPESDQVLTASDVNDISADALAAMQWAVEMGILKGNLDGTLNPNGNASRAHVAAFAERYVNAIA